MIEIATNTFTPSAYTSSSNGISAPVNKYFDQDEHVIGLSANFIVEMDITPAVNSLTNFEFRNGDAMVLVFTISRNDWTSVSSCQLTGGVISTSPTQKAYC